MMFDPTKITRPDAALLKYYVLVSLLTGPGFPLVFLPLYCKYLTLEYSIDDRGISMRWGLLFRREVYLTFRRIQDIHLTRNLLQRWLGLASVSIQTASGKSNAEMVIEGVLEADALRDYLYQQMRGARDDHAVPAEDGWARAEAQVGAAGATGPQNSLEPHSDRATDEALRLLTEIRDLLKQGRASRTESAP